jgi:hypothetical protein
MSNPYTDDDVPRPAADGLFQQPAYSKPRALAQYIWL